MGKINKILLYTIAVSFITFASCNNGVNKNEKDSKYGGTLKINAVSAPDIIFPGQVNKTSEHLIVNQVYDGIVKYHPRTLDIVPSIAKSWLSERNETIYTFYLRNNAYFHNDKCFKSKKDRLITATDVKYSIEQICKTHILSDNNISSQIKNIVGSENIIDKTLSSDTANITGIQVFDDTTIIFYLKKADPLFLHYLAGSNAFIFSKKAFDTYGFKNTIGSGAFIYNYHENKSDEMLLQANKEYYGRNSQDEQLPFIDSIIISFVTSTSKEMELLSEKKIDMVLELPEKFVTPFLDENIDLFQTNPPFLLLKQNPDMEDKLQYNIIRSNIHGFELNSQNYFDFSEAYLKEPKLKEIQTAD